MDWTRADKATFTLSAQAGIAERFSRSPSSPLGHHIQCPLSNDGDRRSKHRAEEREGAAQIADRALPGFPWTLRGPGSRTVQHVLFCLAGLGGRRQALPALTLTSYPRLGRTQRTTRLPPFPKASPDPELEAYLFPKLIKPESSQKCERQVHGGRFSTRELRRHSQRSHKGQRGSFHPEKS